MSTALSHIEEVPFDRALRNRAEKVTALRPGFRHSFRIFSTWAGLVCAAFGGFLAGISVAIDTHNKTLSLMTVGLIWLPLVLAALTDFSSAEFPYAVKLLPGLQEFLREHGHGLKALRKRIDLFNEAVCEYQAYDCPLREQPERYEQIIANLAERRVALIVDQDEMLALYDVALERCERRIKERRIPPPPSLTVLQKIREKQQRDERNRRIAAVRKLEKLLPVFEDGQSVGGPEVTRELSHYVAINEAKRTLNE